MKIAYGYIRVGTLAQAQEQDSSLAAQEQCIRAHFEYRCKPEGFTLGEIFLDPLNSASIPIALRPYGRKFCEVAGEGDCIIVPKFYRAWRDTLDALATIRGWQAKGIKVYVLDAGGIDLSSDVGELVMNGMSMVAKHERRRIRERLDGGKSRIRAADPDAYVGGNTVRWGHKVVRRYRGPGRWMQVPDINLPERKWARWFLELRKRGLNFRQIALYCWKYRIAPRAKNKPMTLTENAIYRALKRECQLRLKESRLAAGKPIPIYPTDFHPGGPQDVPGHVKELIRRGKLTYETPTRPQSSKIDIMFGAIATEGKQD